MSSDFHWPVGARDDRGLPLAELGRPVCPRDQSNLAGQLSQRFRHFVVVVVVFVVVLKFIFLTNNKECFAIALTY